jgi:hypothetical protein
LPAVDSLVHKGYLDELADAYLSAGVDRKDPRVSPLYSDLSGFPPTLISSDPTWIHASHLWNAHLESGRRALASAGAFMRSHL